MNAAWVHPSEVAVYAMHALRALGLGIRDPSFAWPSGLERVLDAARGPITPYVNPDFLVVSAAHLYP